MLNVMLVDDEELERKAVEHIIHENFNILRVVYETSNGQDAVDYALANPVDIIFMDIEMPVKNGIKAAREIRAFNSNVQIIILTAYPIFEYAKEAIDAKVFTYMLKPVNTAELKTALEKIISSCQPEDRRRSDITSLDSDLSAKHMRIIEQVKAMIRSDSRKDLTIDEVADMVKLHPDYLARLFKRKEGIGFKEYVIQMKMEKAKELLRTEMSVKEICYEINYSDPSYFSRSFKKHTGLTASEYKELNGLK
jgi:YesN/AraC family two-component response regulator